nr:MAG TPA: nucelotide kinase [Caudoviricetes sp.]
MKYSVGNYFADNRDVKKFRYFTDLYKDYVKYCNKKSYPVVGSDEFIDNIKEYGVVGEVIQGELVLVYLAEYNRGIDKNVNQPNHYMIGNTGLECKDFISAWVGKGYYSVFCFCNIMKYLVRAEKKNKLEDYKKALKYLDMIIESGADTIVLDIADIGIEVGTKEYTGVEWNEIILEITKGLSARQALSLDSVFRALADENYHLCRIRLADFIDMYKDTMVCRPPVPAK